MFKKLFAKKAQTEVQTTQTQSFDIHMAQLQKNLDNLNNDMLKQNEQMLKAYQAIMA